jgi:hypothetical protein
MLVRIRWDKRERCAVPSKPDLALACAALLVPSALVAFTISLWALSAELHLTANFFVRDGLFSHWQTWLIAAAVLFFAAQLLKRQ